MKKTPEPADPVIDRIRSARHAISEQFDHDTAKLVAHYMELQERYREQMLVPPQPAQRQDRSAA